ncbi:bifunctional methylenetetrahydrofolate dehydrogenase/methenyltetrahydrofolate cyclohydrolase FolD [Ligilactobacillus apodemi]|uniref:Bifunctional protein FolD n=1 Tax=Ligilactobacillus apodemi DSM 16634 = JCM 16172 TaxID=1423724 RepID=A0A0R1TQW1_9LACO|nr:bifunctional methylenetetrahydrofolate dehydrogenase/methenyltetrahydrofolate cyclohydrolase FolD [Ligilactobacillus apodemi]KRL83767.1 methylenetetrahydrofolate dehydrogenase (NADP+) methenyltetrahydrofolate cyclohydrolase [Ligilactobacillus apodemi DSM 16634 = JCM 16172]
MTVMIDGRQTAAKIRSELAKKAEVLKNQGITPCLAVILVGDDPASQVYVRNKKRAAEKIGIETKDLHLSAQTAQSELLELIDSLNDDPSVHAILVQMPLPKHLDENEVINAISPKKDADGLHPKNLGHLFMNEPQALPCTPRGIMVLLAEYDIGVAGKNVVIIGRSNLVGRPLAAMMINVDATVTVAHSKTKNLPEIAKNADILVVATGRAEMVDQSYVKKGATVIDVGINRLPDNHLVGDVDQASVTGVAAYLTPVPGGVGPMTIAMLMQQTLELAEKSK